MSSATLGLLLASGAAAATLMGWLLIAWRPTPSPRLLGTVLLAAGAAMLMVSLLELLPDAAQLLPSPETALLWAALGAMSLLALRVIARRVGRGLAAGTLVAVAIGLHNFPEGATTVAGTLLTTGMGLTIAVSIGLHNIPEGVAVAASAMASGLTRTRAFLLTLVAALAEVAGALAVWVGAQGLDEGSVAGLLAFVAGVMVLLAVTELVPSGWKLLRTSRASAATVT